MLRINEYRLEFVRLDGIGAIVSVLSGRINFQIQYQVKKWAGAFVPGKPFFILTLSTQHNDMQYKVHNCELSIVKPGNTKGESITVLLTSCLNGLD